MYKYHKVNHEIPSIASELSSLFHILFNQLPIDTVKFCDRQILPKYYTRVSSRGKLSAPCTTITQDCASNTTLLTNTSDFNSHQTLITDPNQIKIINNTDKKNQTHYYAENIRHENDLGHKTIYNPLKDLDIVEYKQLQPLLVENKNHIGVKEVDMLMESQEQRDENEMADRKSSGLPTRHYRKKQKNIFTYASQVLAALSVSLGSMVVGFSCSYTSPATVSMRNINITLFEVNEHMSSWIGSIMPLTAIFGGIAGGPSIEYLGRRNTILATAFPFIGAWLFIAMASNVWLILIGRALSGFCVGIASLSLPVYLGETIQPEVRGTLGLLPTAFGNIGILLCYIAGMYLNWYNLAFFGALLPIPFLLLMFLIPETPRWYVSKGKTKRARKSLQWLRGNNVDVTEELTAVEKTHIDSEKNSSQGTMSELLKGSHIKLLFLSLGLMFFQQMSGINAVIFYTEKIFKDAGSTIDSSLSAMIVGVVNFASTFVATALIDRLGRKILLYISSVTMIITLICLGAFFYMKNTNYDVSNIGWLPLVCLVTYVIGFSLGFGPIPWLMMGEILPAKIRGPAASIATGFNWTCTFIITKTFQNVMSIIGAASTFWIFGGVCVVGLMFVILFIPETRGRSLEEIEKRLTGPVRRMSSVANMKPMPTAC